MKRRFEVYFYLVPFFFAFETVLTHFSEDNEGRTVRRWLVVLSHFILQQEEHDQR